MDRQKINRKAKTINIKANSKKEFFLLHGYTGSPTDFNQLGKYLNKRFNANVKIIRLKGHGEVIENLDNLTYKDFFKQAEEELKKDIKKGMDIVIGGISIGSLLALHLSSKHSVKGILNIATPYKNRFLAGLVSFFEPVIWKKHWKKPYVEKDRDKAFFYDVHIGGLKVIKQAKKELEKELEKINAPNFIIHIEGDKIFHKKGSLKVKNKINSKINKFLIFKTNDKISHNPFFTENPEKIYKIIGDFVEKHKLFG